MTRWEYRVEHIQTNLQDTLTNLGDNGWELVSAEGHRMILKRPESGAP